MVTRESIMNALLEALEPLSYVHSMWEGGSAAFARADEWSDIDVQVVVDDERVAEVYEVVEGVLAELSPIDVRYPIPQPTWHGHDQRFYRLHDTSPFLLIDFVVMKQSNPEKFREREMHGNAIVHIDRLSEELEERINIPLFLDKLREHVADTRIRFDLFQILTLKELNRGNGVEALGFYLAHTLRPLVEILGIKYRPAHYNYYTRYLAI